MSSELVKQLRERAKDNSQRDKLTPGCYSLPPREYLEWQAADRIATLEAQVAKARAEGFAAAREQAARVAETYADALKPARGWNPSEVEWFKIGCADVSAATAQAIRTMEDLNG